MEAQDVVPKVKVNRIMRFHFQIGEIYRSLQKPFVRDLQWCDTKLRILSTCYDFIFMFWPSMIFAFAVIALVSPLNTGDEFLYNTEYLVMCYCMSMLIFNSFSAVYMHGQTIGKRYYSLKIVKKNNDQCSLMICFIREFIGKSVPMAILFYFFQLYGFIAFCLLDGIVACIDTKHRSIIDIFLGTKIVVLPGREVLEMKTIVPEPDIKEEIKVDENIQVENPKEEVTTADDVQSDVIPTPEEALNDMMDNIVEIPLDDEVKEDKEIVRAVIEADLDADEDVSNGLSEEKNMDSMEVIDEIKEEATEVEISPSIEDEIPANEAEEVLENEIEEVAENEIAEEIEEQQADEVSEDEQEAVEDKNQTDIEGKADTATIKSKPKKKKKKKKATNKRK